MWSALAAARCRTMMSSDKLEIVVVAPAQEIHIRPRLYEAQPENLAVDLTHLYRQVNVQFIPGHVNTIDSNKKQLCFATENGETTCLDYDRLILAAGSRLNTPKISGLESTFNVDQMDAAIKLERHINGLAERPNSAERNTVVVCGGGFTGIETAAEMPARLKAALGEVETRVVVVDRNSEIGQDLGAGPRPVVIEALSSLGVEQKLGAGVAEIDSNGVTLDNGERINAHTVVWTAGARANSLTDQVPGELDEFGRLRVDAFLQVAGVPDVYATGDCAVAATDNQHNVTMLSCQHAMNLGRSAGHNAAANILEGEQLPYSQPKYVTCLDLGPWGAVYTEGWERQVKMQGKEAKELKTKINQEWIYPPEGTLDEIWQAADPQRIVVA